MTALCAIVVLLYTISTTKYMNVMIVKSINLNVNFLSMQNDVHRISDMRLTMNRFGFS